MIIVPNFPLSLFFSNNTHSHYSLNQKATSQTNQNQQNKNHSFFFNEKKHLSIHPFMTLTPSLHNDLCLHTDGTVFQDLHNLGMGHLPHIEAIYLLKQVTLQQCLTPWFVQDLLHLQRWICLTLRLS